MIRVGELLQRDQVVADIFSNGRMWTTARLDGSDAAIGERAMPHQEFSVFSREDIVRDDGEAVAIAERLAQGQEKRRFAAAHRTANADREASGEKIATERLAAFVKESRARLVFMRVGVRVVVHLDPQCARTTIETAASTAGRVRLATG